MNGANRHRMYCVGAVLFLCGCTVEPGEAMIIMPPNPLPRFDSTHTEVLARYFASTPRWSVRMVTGKFAAFRQLESGGEGTNGYFSEYD